MTFYYQRLSAWWLRVFTLALYVLSSLSHAEVPPNLLEPRVKAFLLNSIQSAPLFDPDISWKFKAHYPCIFEPFVQFGSVEFEQDVASLLYAGANETSIEIFKSKWQLTSSEALWVLNHYSLLWFQEDANSHSPETVFKQIRMIAHAVYLNPHKEDYHYYRQAITTLSVTEMAGQKGISEGAVYHQLNLYQLTFMEAFNRSVNAEEMAQLKDELSKEGIDILRSQWGPNNGALDLLELLAARGLDDRKLLELGHKVFGFTRQALREWLHNRHTSSASWSRSAYFMDQELSETEILVRLVTARVPYLRIAEILNNIFGHGPLEGLRTEKSVLKKVRQLDLQALHSPASSDIYDPRYGFLKKDGHLVAIGVYQLFFDQPQAKAEALAEQLGVSLTSFQDFLKTHKIHSSLARMKAPQTHGKLQNYALLQSALHTLLAQIRSFESGFEDSVDLSPLKRAPEWIKLVYGQLRNTKEGLQRKQVIKDGQEFWLSLYKASQLEGSLIHLSEVIFEGEPSAEFKTILLNEAYQASLRWMEQHPGQIPCKDDFGPSQKQIRTNYNRLCSLNAYKHRGLCANSQVFWLHLYDYVRIRGLPFNMLGHYILGERLPEIKDIEKEEATDQMRARQRRNKEPGFCKTLFPTQL